jgi:hypothetical protein
MVDSFETYGRLTEALHIAGYSFERACGNLEWMLAEDRWRLDGRFTDVNAFLDSIRLDKFRQAAEQRKRIAESIKALQPAASNRQIARTLGVDDRTIRRDTAANAAPAAENTNEYNWPNEGPAANAARPLSGAQAAKLVERLDALPDAKRAEQAAIVNRTSFTGNDEWFTPADWLERVRAVLGEIDLDPASHELAQRRVRARCCFAAEDDGLTQDWHGRVFLNPPYAQPLIEQFIDKLLGEIDAGRVSEAVLLTHNYTDTAWFQKAGRQARAIFFTRGRIKFETPCGEVAAPTQGQAVFYFGPDAERFSAAFRELGLVMGPIR